jgi:hypothetical protein
MGSDEVIWGDWVLRLDGNVVEILHSSGVGYRYHANHVAVEAKPTDHGMTVRVGIDVSGTLVEGTTMEVPLGVQPQVEALFAAARKRRERAGGAPAG